MDPGEKYDPAKATALVNEHSRPFAFEMIAKLGMTPDNYTAWEKSAKADDDLGPHLERLKTAGAARAEIQTDTRRAQRLAAYLKPGGRDLDKDAASIPEDAKDQLAKLQKELPYKHLVWSFRQAAQNRDVLRDRTGRGEGEESRPLGEVKESVSMRYEPRRPVRKREVLWHPKGSPLAEEAARLFAMRR